VEINLHDGLLPDLPFHHKVRWSEPCTFQEQVEIGPFEHQFGHVVELGIFQQAHWSDGREWIFPGQWFLVVVEINDVGFPEA
jgi:hypothetical protein